MSSSLLQWARGADHVRTAMLLLASLTVGTAIAQTFRGLSFLTGSDAVAFQAAGRIISQHGCIYCINTEKAAQMALLGGHLQPGTVKPYNNPPLVAWMLQPLAGLGYAAYTHISVILVAAALVVSLILAVRLVTGIPQMRLGRVIVALTLMAPLPGLETLVLAQWDAVMLVALLSAYLLMRAQHSFFAGLALAVLLIKPQDVWLVPVVLMIAGAWPVLRGFALGAGVWVVSSLAVVNVATLLHMTGSLGENRFELQFTDGLPGIVAAIAGPNSGFLVAAAGLVLVAAAAWFFRLPLRRDPMLALDLGIAASLLFAPHLFSDDLLLLGPVLIDVARRNLGLAVLGVVTLDAAYLAERPLFQMAGHVQAIALLGVLVLVVALVVRDRNVTLVGTGELARASNHRISADARLLAPVKHASEDLVGHLNHPTIA